MPTRAGYEATERLREQSLNPRHAIEPAVDARRVLPAPPEVSRLPSRDDRVNAVAALEHVTSGAPVRVSRPPRPCSTSSREANEEVEERRPLKLVLSSSADEAAGVRDPGVGPLPDVST